MSESQPNIESTMQETRVFPPPAKFVSRARVNSKEEYARMYRQSIDQPEEFWSGIAQQLHWIRMWDKVLEWNAPHAKWFAGGRLNACYNCVDRPLPTRGEQTAIIWAGDEPGEYRYISYRDVKHNVARIANVLLAHGVRKGDRVPSTCR